MGIQRISPPISQIVLPSPKPLSMLIDMYRPATTTRSGQSSNDDPYSDVKGLPGQYASYVRDMRANDAWYQTETNRIFAEGMTSRDAKAYWTQPETMQRINKLRSRYLDQKYAIEANKSYMADSLGYFKTLKENLDKQNVSTDHYVYNEQGKIGLPVPGGRVGTAGGLLEYNRSHLDYSSPFVDYNPPDFDALTELWNKKLSHKGKAETGTDVTRVYPTGVPSGARPGNQLGIIGTSISETNIDDTLRVDQAWGQFLDEVYSRQDLTRAYNALENSYVMNKFLANPLPEGTTEEEAESITAQYRNEFQENYKRGMVDSKYTIVRRGSGTDLYNTSSENMASNFAMDVYWGNTDRLDVAGYAPFEDIRRDIVSDPLQSIYEKPEFKKEYDLFNLLGEAILNGSADIQSLMQHYQGKDKETEILNLILEAGEKAKKQVGLSPDDPSYQAVFRETYQAYITDAATRYALANTPNEIRYEYIKKRLYHNLSEEEKAGLPKRRKSPWELFIESLTRAWADIDEEGELQTGPNSNAAKYNVPVEKHWMNFKESQQIGMTEYTQIFRFPTSSFEKTEMYRSPLRQISDKVLFLGNYIDSNDLTAGDDEFGYEAYIIDAISAYNEMPFRDENGKPIKTVGLLGRVMIKAGLNLEDEIMISLPDSKTGRLVSKPLADFLDDEAFLKELGIIKVTLNQQSENWLTRRNISNYKPGDEVWLIDMNFKWGSIKTDMNRKDANYNFQQVPNMDAFTQSQSENPVYGSGALEQE